MFVGGVEPSYFVNLAPSTTVRVSFNQLPRGYWLFLFMKKITGIEAQKNPNRVNIFLNDEFAFGLATTVAAWLRIGQQLDEEKIQRLRSDDDRERASQRALNFLSYRDRSEQEVTTNLTKAGYSQEVIENVIVRLAELSLVDDRKFAKTWVDNRNEFRPRGKRALAYELRQKGIDQLVIEETLGESVDEDALALKAARKIFSKFISLPRVEFKQKLIGYLARRGFNYAACDSAVRTLWDEIQSDGDQQNYIDEEIE